MNLDMDFNRRILLAGLGAASLSPLALGKSHGESWRRSAFSELANAASTLVEQRQVAGIAVGISARGFRQSAYHGVSDVQTNRPVTEATNFRIASVTKPIVAACVLQLLEADLVSLDETLDRFFPTFPKAEQITVYQLLTHTSGIANWWGRLPASAPDGFMNSGRANEWLAQMEPVFNFEPGTMREYSNSGYVLLGQIIEQITDEDLDTALQEYVLSRVGAGATFLERDLPPMPDWARGHTVEAGEFAPTAYVDPPFAAGGLRATLHDILAFGDAVFEGQLLQPETRSRMTAHAAVSDGRLVEEALYLPPGISPEVLPPEVTEMGYGLGINTWVQSEERFFSHAGLIDGFGSYFLHAPRTGTTVALLANTFQGTADLHELIRQILIKAPSRA